MLIFIGIALCGQARHLTGNLSFQGCNISSVILTDLSSSVRLFTC